jgi:hypothetical protein
MHEIWAIALFIAYMDWHAFEDFVVRILRRSRTPADDPAPKSAAVVTEESKA